MNSKVVVNKIVTGLVGINYLKKKEEMNTENTHTLHSRDVYFRTNARKIGFNIKSSE